MPALISSLKSDHPPLLRREVIEVLSRIGTPSPEAKQAVPALLEALKDNDKEVRYAAATALVKIEPYVQEAMPILRRAAKDYEQLFKARKRSVAPIIGEAGDIGKRLSTAKFKKWQKDLSDRGLSHDEDIARGGLALDSTAADARQLEAWLTLPKVEVEYGEQVMMQLELTNRSTGPLFVIDPDLYTNRLTGESTVQVLIQDDAARSVPRIKIGVDNSGIGPTFGRLEPAETIMSSHPLYSQLVRGNHDFPRYLEWRVKQLGRWAFLLGDDTSNPLGSVEEFLPPGRYTMQLRYRLAEETLMPGNLSHVWRGEALSNTVTLMVKKESGKTSMDRSASFGDIERREY